MCSTLDTGCISIHIFYAFFYPMFLCEQTLNGGKSVWGLSVLPDQQTASGVLSYNNHSPVASTWKSNPSNPLAVEFVRGMLNFSSRCFQ